MCRECEGNFLTDPGSIRLYLPEIAEFFEESLPLYAKIFLNCDVSDDNISCLVSDVVTMTHVAIKTSVIATACWVDHNSLVEIKDDDDQSLPVAIPTDLNIEVSLLEPQPMHDDELYRTTRQLFEGFQSTRIKDMKRASTCTSTSDPMKMLQIKLTHSVREGHERQGVTIEKPNKVYKSSKRAPTNKKGMDLDIVIWLCLRRLKICSQYKECLVLRNNFQFHGYYLYSNPEPYNT